MSRNLYTIATVVQPVVDQLKELRRSDAQAWWEGAGEDLLRVRLVSGEPLVASYRVVLDGWNSALADIARVLDERSPPWFRAFADAVETEGLGIWRADSMDRLRVPATRSKPLNWYAILALQDAIENGVRFSVATGCSLVVLKRTLDASFDDGDFRLAAGRGGRGGAPDAPVCNKASHG